MSLPRITWQISGTCSSGCWFCLPKYRDNPTFKTLDEYLTVVDKLHNYGERSSIEKFHWKFKGGEPLQFSNLNIVLKEIKKKSSFVSIETAGGNSWFDILSIAEHIDRFDYSHHYWQNISITNYIIDYCKNNNKELVINLPLLPGKILEGKELVKEFKEQDITVVEQLVMLENGLPLENYTLQELNIFYGRPENWIPPPPEPTPSWIDPRIQNGSPSHTGKLCWAGVDWLYINSKGFTTGSECNGRYTGNVFLPNWTPPDQPFPCNQMFCHSSNDRKNIRMEK